MTVEERRRRRFSEEFRKEQVGLIESGVITIKEVSRLYDVKASSVRLWIKKFGKKGLPEPILIGSTKDLDRLKSLESENKRLKELIADQAVALAYKEELLHHARERLGDDFEKK